MTEDQIVEAGAKALWVHDGVKAPWDGAPEAARRRYCARFRAALKGIEGIGCVIRPKQPTPGLLMSMAIRADHGLAIPGYYDQPIFGAENIGHARRLEVALTSARQQHEEVIGTGFYSHEREAAYVAMTPAPKEPT